MSKLTLVVPTYNRPAELSRLLTYLRNWQAQFPIVVLDSSASKHAAENARTCASIRDVRHETYAPDTHFYDKLANGVRRLVVTDAACLCADDDFVIPATLTAAAAALLADTSTSVAHGYYAQFTLEGSGRLTDLACSAPDIANNDPLHRVSTAMLHYEATIYGIHRTPVLLRLLEEAAAAPSLFAAELLTTVLAMAEGKARRLPLFTHARSIAPSHGARRWHPAELLATDPAHLVQSLQFLRSRLITQPDIDQSRIQVFDLALVAYLSDYTRPDAARRLARLALKGASTDELYEAGWSEFATMLQPSGWRAATRSSKPARWLKQRLANQPALRQKVMQVFRASRGMPTQVNISAPDGSATTVVLETPFVRALAGIGMEPFDARIVQLAEGLCRYASAGNSGRSRAA